MREMGGALALTRSPHLSCRQTGLSRLRCHSVSHVSASVKVPRGVRSALIPSQRRGVTIVSSTNFSFTPFSSVSYIPQHQKNYSARGVLSFPDGNKGKTQSDQV